jgi:hypothetical protein
MVAAEVGGYNKLSLQMARLPGLAGDIPSLLSLLMGVLSTEGMQMSNTIGLYQGLTRQGEVEFDTVFVMEPADYVCKPKGVVTYDEVAQIAKVLRREGTHAGVVGKYEWHEELPPEPMRRSGILSTTA